jgi:signal transduction histidine kinase
MAVRDGSSRREWLYRLPNGEPLPTETTWAHIRHQGETLVIVYSLDSRPIMAAAEAEASNMAKSRFLARMSHEIRTPITAVMGISEVQLRGQLMPPHIEEAFSKIYDSSKILLNIVNDILDFSKIESGKMSLLEKEYDVASLAGDISQLHLVYLDNKDISFQMSVDETLPAKLLGDSLRIRQIISNLLTNAFKYTDSGTVILSLSHSRNKDGYIDLVISVTDTGMGMTAAQIDEVQGLNSEYVRLHENERPFVSGTGLGLPIVYSMVQMMNAQFDLQSDVGKGTIVTVKIPQKIIGTDTLGAEQATQLQNFESGTWAAAKDFNFVPEQMTYGRVLVVDDVDTNLYVAGAMLESFGLTVELVESGRAAIDKIINGSIYDVIFLDHMMPEMDGIEVSKTLRAMGYNRPIVALTANAIKGQAEMFMQNGFSGFMTKPIDIKILNSYLVRFVKK